MRGLSRRRGRAGAAVDITRRLGRPFGLPAALDAIVGSFGEVVVGPCNAEHVVLGDGGREFVLPSRAPLRRVLPEVAGFAESDMGTCARYSLMKSVACSVAPLGPCRAAPIAALQREMTALTVDEHRHSRGDGVSARGKIPDA